MVSIVGTVDAELHLYFFAVLVVLNSETATGVPVDGEQFGPVVELELFISVVLDDPVGEDLDGEGWGGLFDDPHVDALHAVDFHKIGVVLVLLFEECELAVQDVLPELYDCFMNIL